MSVTPHFMCMFAQSLRRKANADARRFYAHVGFAEMNSARDAEVLVLRRKRGSA